MWRDMVDLKARALEIDGAEGLIGALDVITPTRIGERQRVRVIDSKGAADFIGVIKLGYYRGRGDCPAGCIESASGSRRSCPERLATAPARWW